MDDDNFGTPEKIVNSLSVSSNQSPSAPAFLAVGESLPFSSPIPMRKISYDEAQPDEKEAIDQNIAHLKQTHPIHLVARDEIVKEVFPQAK
mmetsp:Transcript_18687/g.28615  ORF Transcript_18687/g.28615 Transcript_18687/m.28615 type:complete len:91 (-) Transcript_18687:142-414(-)|eukprot:CAMPEP_0170480576 /NCGR_PEP_ID=MMETSP0208-20121228/1365_1 /TAXON_ID=197538 /ORGANISM="Strombidium inclinatum, Strain S3" /LENGTH=90 /DNA_ID=CAMNT_0010753147 /DNA_START=12 /DNA_END=284 /DNA_ORIENTATION=-